MCKQAASSGWALIPPFSLNPEETPGSTHRRSEGPEGSSRVLLSCSEASEVRRAESLRPGLDPRPWPLHVHAFPPPHLPSLHLCVDGNICLGLGEASGLCRVGATRSPFFRFQVLLLHRTTGHMPQAAAACGGAPRGQRTSSVVRSGAGSTGLCRPFLWSTET